MEIVEQTQSKLTLKRRTSWSDALLGAILTSVPLAIVCILPAVTLSCNKAERTQISCDLTSSSLLVPETTRSVEQLQGARVDKAREYDGKNYRVVLRSGSGEVPFSVSSSSYANHASIADRVNAFVKNPGIASLNVKLDKRWLVYLIGGPLACMGFLAILSALLYKESCTFDKGNGRLTFKKQDLFANNTAVHPLRDVSVRVEERTYDGDTDSDEHKFYRLALVLKDNESKLMNVSNYSSDEREIQAKADRISQFIQAG